MIRTFKIYSLSSFQICNTVLLFFFINDLFLAALVFVAACGLSLAAVSSGYSLVVMRGLPTAVASLFCRARALGCAGLVVVACVLSSCQAGLSARRDRIFLLAYEGLRYDEV